MGGANGERGQYRHNPLNTKEQNIEHADAVSAALD